MIHRHLNHEGFTLAAIDDVIARGRLPDWRALRDAVDADPSVRSKVRRICAAMTADPLAQRYHFWSLYVRQWDDA